MLQKTVHLGILPMPSVMWMTCSTKSKSLSSTPTRELINLIEILDFTSDCIEGVSFGISEGKIWVDKGCRALFLLQNIPGKTSKV